MRMIDSQRGYATLVVALVLLVAITLITLYGARTSLMKQRILGNEVRATQSFVEAERGLDEGAMFVSRNIDELSDAWVGSRWEACADGDTALPCGDGSDNIFDSEFVRYVDPTDNTKKYVAELSDGEPRTVYLVARCKDEAGDGTCDHVGPGQYRIAATDPDPHGALIHTIATGTSDDTTGSATLRQSLYIYQLVSSPPASPLTIRAAATVSGSFQIVTNPNGGGTGVPVSIWSNEDVDVTTNAVTTCERGEYELNGGTSCPNNPQQSLTVDGDPGIDIVDEATTFPSDMFEYVFGIPSSEYQQVKDRAIAAGHLLSDCSTLDTTSKGLYWIEGACDLKVEIGSIDDPVLLVIADGALEINAGAKVYGLVFPFDVPNGTTAGGIKLNGNAYIQGGLVADRSPTHTNGSLTIYYDSDLLTALVSSGSLAASGRVPGSWVDYHE